MEKDWKIKVIIKRPDEKVGHVTNISLTLKNLQRTVGGNIEVVPVDARGALIICNEEGKLKCLEPNFCLGPYMANDLIRGTVIVCGSEGEDFADVPLSLSDWKLILEMWGNETK